MCAELEAGICLEFDHDHNHMVIDDANWMIENKDSIRNRLVSVFVQRGCAVLIDDSFRSCGSLRRITFASGSVLKRIGKGAFSSCKSLKEICIPASVEDIGDDCFYRCSFLSRVTFESGSALKRIGDSAFSHCPHLEEMEIPASVEEICSSCFEAEADVDYVCVYSSLSRVTFGKGSRLKRIGRGAFLNCWSLESIEIPLMTEVDGDIDVNVIRKDL